MTLCTQISAVSLCRILSITDSTLSQLLYAYTVLLYLSFHCVVVHIIVFATHQAHSHFFCMYFLCDISFLRAVALWTHNYVTRMQFWEEVKEIAKLKRHIAFNGTNLKLRFKLLVENDGEIHISSSSPNQDSTRRVGQWDLRIKSRDLKKEKDMGRSCAVGFRFTGFFLLLALDRR